MPSMIVSYSWPVPNAFMSAPVPLNSGCCAPPCPANPPNSVPGPAGENAFSLTTLAFTQPAVGANVVVTLTHDGWVVVGQTVFIEGGGFYIVASISGLAVTLTNTGDTGNAVPGIVVGANAKVSPAGVPGAGIDSFTTTAANFVQPAIGANVNAQVVDSDWAAVGQRVFVVTGGYYTVFAVPDPTHVTLTNDGDPGNAAPGVVINFPQKVSPAGLRGAAGATGVSTLNAVSPTTTKGDLIVDNGANSPAAGDVRLGVGTDGKALVADSTQPTGLAYATITPNVAATARDIAVLSGTAGTPLAVVDSKLLITTDGAIQSTPTGGNARGAKAVDLQVSRVAPGQVASGASAGILAGENNTASGADSVVGGGSTNVASAANAGVACGFTNSASAANAFVGGGNNNIASGANNTVAGGAGNTASAAGGGATICGGDNNTASGTDSFVGAGNGNVASAQESSVLCGNSNQATVRLATVLGGISAKASLWGQLARNAGIFAALGDCQTTELLWRIATTDATANVEAFLDGTSLRAVVPLNTVWAFFFLVAARSSAGVCAAWSVSGAIQNNANTVSLVAAVNTSVIADGTTGTWGVVGGLVVSADNVNKSLKVAVTGAALTNIRWNAHARITELGF